MPTSINERAQLQRLTADRQRAPSTPRRVSRPRPVEDTEPQIPAEDGGGTLVALGLAAAIALVAGSVVILIRKP